MSACYIHIPFCRRKCHYCSFSSTPFHRSLMDPYLAALHKELRQIPQSVSAGLTSIFIGGGTPTILADIQLVSLLDCCRQSFAIEPEAEITVEANPGTIDYRYLLNLHRSGVTRLSLGGQSFVNKELKKLGRTHTGEDTMDAVRAARRAGFTNISLDLMYGIPGQSPDSWRQSLDQALELDLDHLSIYQLSVDPHTDFYLWQREGKLEMIDEDAVLEMDDITAEHLGSSGYSHYEVSNFARPGKQCRHNLNYWHNGSYLAAGAAAVSFVDGYRQKRTADVGEYIERITSGISAVVSTEHLSLTESFRETVVMGLRLTEGVAIATLEDRFAIDPVAYYGETLEKLQTGGFLLPYDTRLCLTPYGRRFANRVMAELV